MRLLQTELLKVRTAPRTSIALLVGLLGLVALGSAATASEAGGEDRERILAWDVIGVASISTVFALILGILIVTWEYRHGTITQTFLVTPRRARVIAAKYAASSFAGVLLSVLSLALALLVGALWVSLDLGRGHWELAGRVVFGAALWAVLGAGLGALIQSQVGAIVTSFVWFLVAEPLIGLPLDSIADYLPGNVLDRLQNSDVAESGSEGFVPPEHPYSLWGAAVLGSIYAAIIAALGIVSAVRRDVP